MVQDTIPNEQKALIKEVIVLEDNGQDMQRIYIDEGGEIIGCDFNSDTYRGALVDPQSIVKGYPLHIMLANESAFSTYHKLIVEEVISL